MEVADIWYKYLNEFYIKGDRPGEGEWKKEIIYYKEKIKHLATDWRSKEVPYKRKELIYLGIEYKPEWRQKT